MKWKYFLVILFLVLAMFLVGCNSIGVTPSDDEAKIKSVVYEYFLAINDQNWSKAKSCCVYGSDRYYKTCVIEDTVKVLYQYSSIVTITCVVNITNVSIYGNNADACGYGTIIITAGYYSDSDSGSSCYHLQKVGNSWKIYGP